MGFISHMLTQALDDAARDTDLKRTALRQKDVTTGEIATQAQLLDERLFGDCGHWWSLTAVPVVPDQRAGARWPT